MRALLYSAVVPGELTLISRPQGGLADAAGQKRKASPQNQIINGPHGSNPAGRFAFEPNGRTPGNDRSEQRKPNRSGDRNQMRNEFSRRGHFLGQPQCSSSRFYDGEWIVGVVDRGPGSSIAPASAELRRYLGCAESANQALRNNPNQRQSTAESASSGNR